MNDLILTTPSKEHETQVMAFREEMQRNGEGFCGCSGLEDTPNYDEWLDFNGRIARLGWTPSTTYIGIRASDGMLIGMIDLRHELSAKKGMPLRCCCLCSKRQKTSDTKRFLCVATRKTSNLLGDAKVWRRA